MGMRINTDSYNGWNGSDGQTVANTNGSVQHGASAVQTLREAGEEFLHLLPDRMFTAPKYLAVDNVGEGIGAVLLGIGADAVELLVLPLMILWDLVQALMHGIMYLVNLGHGEHDGEVDPGTIREFDFIKERDKKDPKAPPPGAPLHALALPKGR